MISAAFASDRKYPSKACKYPQVSLEKTWFGGALVSLANNGFLLLNGAINYGIECVKAKFKNYKFASDPALFDKVALLAMLTIAHYANKDHTGGTTLTLLHSYRVVHIIYYRVVQVLKAYGCDTCNGRRVEKQVLLCMVFGVQQCTTGRILTA